MQELVTFFTLKNRALGFPTVVPGHQALEVLLKAALIR